jgi:nucleoside-triphosphatase THEP1
VYPESGSVNFFTLDDLGKVMRHYKAALAANGFEIRVMPIREEGKLIGFDMMALGRGDKRSVSVNGSFIRRVDTDVSEIQMRFGSNDPPSRRD